MQSGYRCPMCEYQIIHESPFFISIKAKMHIDMHCNQFAERLKDLC